MLWALLREAELLGLLSRRPRGLRAVWTWPAPPHVDPAKEARAARERLESGLTTLIDELATQGLSLDDHLAKVARVRKAFAGEGLDPDEWLPRPGRSAAESAHGLTELAGRLDEVEEALTHPQTATAL